MIISHKHRFIFFKPIKCAGTSIEVSLIPALGKDDIMTGTAYQEELQIENINYSPRNNLKLVGIQKIPGQESHIVTAEPIYHSHTPPTVLREITSDSLQDYFKFSIIRNPWDMLVSFFWWSFHGFTPVGQEKKNNSYTHRGRMSIVPMRSDPDPVLKAKFQNFIESSMNKDDAVGLPYLSDNDTVISWLEKLYPDFVCDDVDLVLRFEDLKSDYAKLCRTLDIREKELPRFKSNVRKSKKHYSSYYNDYSRDIVAEKFKTIIERFEYKF